MATSYARHRFHTLDGMRGIAAICVMLYHYQLYCGHPLYWFNEGYLAVDFFFVLSGFVVLHSYGNKLLNGMSAMDYLSRRVARLFPFLAVGVLLGIPGIMGNVTSLSNAQIIFSSALNLCFIPYFHAGDSLFPSDSPLWSIFFEMLASIAFLRFFKIGLKPLVFLAAASWSVFIASIFVLNWIYPRIGVEFGFSPATFLGGFPRVAFGFLTGMALYRIYTSGAAPRLSVHPALLYLLLVGMLIFPNGLHKTYYFLALTFLSPALVLLGCQAVASGVTGKASEFLGWMSFPLYCLHRPVFNDIHMLKSHGYHIPHSALTAAAVLVLLAVGIGAVFDRMKFQRRIAGMLYSPRQEVA